jgi:hypothetical protein
MHTNNLFMNIFAGCCAIYGIKDKYYLIMQADFVILIVLSIQNLLLQKNINNKNLLV